MEAYFGVGGVGLRVQSHVRGLRARARGPDHQPCQVYLISGHGTTPDQGHGHPVPALRMFVGEEHRHVGLSRPHHSTRQPLDVHVLLPAGTREKYNCTQDHQSSPVEVASRGKLKRAVPVVGDSPPFNHVTDVFGTLPRSCRVGHLRFGAGSTLRGKEVLPEPQAADPAGPRLLVQFVQRLHGDQQGAEVLGAADVPEERPNRPRTVL